MENDPQFSFKKQNKKTFRNKTSFQVELFLLFHQGNEVTVQQKKKSHKESLNSHLNRLNLWFELRTLLNSD